MPIRRIIVLSLGFTVVALGVSPPVAAQNVPSAEVSGGYQFLNLSAEGEGEALAKGWYVDVAGNLSETFGIVFEAGGSYKSVTETDSFPGTTLTSTADLRLHEFMGGVRFSARTNSTIVPYGQFLAGGVSTSVGVSAEGTIFGMPISHSEEHSETNAALQAGGGVNVLLTGRVGIRVGADYLRVFVEDTGVNVFRFTGGIVVPFGR